MVDCPLILKKKLSPLFSSVQASESKVGITLTELLIVVAVIAILMVVLLSAFKPWTQQAKARDSRRKADLQKLKNPLEDYYNDHNCYPPDLPTLVLEDYIDEEPKDPETGKGYTYVPDENCNWYRIYARLEYKTDSEIVKVGCGGGCGPGGGCDYNYGVCSGDTELEGCIEKCAGGRPWSYPPDCEAPQLEMCNTTQCCEDGYLTCYPDGYWCCPITEE